MAINFSRHGYPAARHLASLLVVWTPCSAVASRLKRKHLCHGVHTHPFSVYGSPSAPLAVWGGLFILRQPHQLALHWPSTCLPLTDGSATAFSHRAQQFMAPITINPFPSAGSVAEPLNFFLHHVYIRQRHWLFLPQCVYTRPGHWPTFKGTLSTPC